MLRKSLSIIASFLILFSNISYSYTAGETLRSYGAISGDQYGNLNETNNLNRADMAVLLASLNGKSQEAKAFKLQSTFTDVPKTAWYAPYVAYAEAMNWTHGVGGGKYAPTANVSVKDTAAFLMNVLGKNYNYERVLSEASQTGIKNGLSGSGNITRGSAFSAMLDALKVIPEGKKESLGSLLGYFKSENSENVELQVVSIEASKKDTFKVLFNKSITDRTKITFSVKRLSYVTPVTVTWSDSLLSANLANSTDLASGVYEVVVTESGKELKRQSVLIQEQKVSAIQITSPNVNFISGMTGMKGYASYSIFDQYGEDITLNIPASDLLFTSANGLVTGGAGSLVISPYDSSQSFTLSNSFVIIIFHSKTGISQNATLASSIGINTLSELKPLTAGVNVQNGSASYVYIPYQAFDSIGLPTKNFTVIQNGLIDYNYQGAADITVDLINSSNAGGIKAEIVPDTFDSSKAVIRITPGNVVLAQDIELFLSVSNKAGATSVYSIKILK